MKKADAINYFGSAAELARKLNISEAAVSQWGDTIPQGRAYQIEVVTGGALKADPRCPVWPTAPLSARRAGHPAGGDPQRPAGDGRRQGFPHQSTTREGVTTMPPRHINPAARPTQAPAVSAINLVISADIPPLMPIAKFTEWVGVSVDTARHWVKTGRLDVMEKTRANELVMVKVHVFIAKQMAGHSSSLFTLAS